MRNRKLTPEEKIMVKFFEAYKTLSSEVYIPEKYREGYMKLARKIGRESKAPTSLKLLALKVELDDMMRNYVHEIYRACKLKNYVE
jgi:hypothetical protein